MLILIDADGAVGANGEVADAVIIAVIDDGWVASAADSDAVVLYW